MAQMSNKEFFDMLDELASSGKLSKKEEFEEFHIEGEKPIDTVIRVFGQKDGPFFLSPADIPEKYISEINLGRKTPYIKAEWIESFQSYNWNFFFESIGRSDTSTVARRITNNYFEDIFMRLSSIPGVSLNSYF